MGSHAGDLSQFSQEYIDYDQGPAVIGVSIAVGLLALASVGLRLWARHIKRVSLGIEDYLIIVCVVRIKKMSDGITVIVMEPAKIEGHAGLTLFM